MNASLVRNRLFVPIVSAVVVVALVVVAVVMYVRQPTSDDFAAAKNTQLAELTEARKALRPAVNTYLAAYKNAYNSTGELDAANKQAQGEYDAVKSVEKKIDDAISSLQANRVANDAETGAAIEQLVADYRAETTYYSGMVDSYPDYVALFGSKEKRCSPIFVGNTPSLSERRQKLDAAAKTCIASLDDLKESANSSFADYAHNVERRVTQMQEYAKATETTEENYKKLQQEAAVLQKKASEALSRDASDRELFAVRDELKEMNARVDEEQAQFDFAAKRYIGLVEEMPTLYSEVFSKAVTAKIQASEQLITSRQEILDLILAQYS